MESLSLRFLYRTLPGRAALKLLTRPGFSRLAGRYLDSRASRWLIPRAAKSWRVDSEEFEEEEYPSFNAFFTRRRREEFLNIDREPGDLISPCDGYLSAFTITESSAFSIKGSSYSLRDLLEDDGLAERYRGGLCLIFRLTPANYHRYCHLDDGEVLATRMIPGVLHCVRPIACERFPVYVQNSREWARIRTEHFGEIVQMEIGALMVGRIVNAPVEIGSRVVRGQEKGRFEFGGSTIVVLVEAGRVKLDSRVPVEDVQGAEMEVRLGERIGVRI